ncbi:hypothetical protein DSL72_001935 [Monilinia vaccinii-corymbosi]|uniref:Uncharacterized protein n=1 Tax=Monilinia vaccinii-corymbosi TaxID=61207 RepID=A0A8A3PB73_9HELO|nr:hypothetical protein DSL72_001935 [Monilinia vaccinii-corymbosi]
MAEVEQVDVPSSTSPQIAPIPESQSTSPPQGDSSPRLDDHQPPPSAEISHQQVLLEKPPSEKSAPEHSDGEVEFVFAVPRRRKKKRRRLEIPPQGTHVESSSPIPSAEVSVTRPFRDKSTADIAPLLAPATEPGDMGMARCRSIHALHPPATFASSLQPLNVLQSDLSNPSPSHVSQTIPFKIPPPWYAKSMPPPPSPMSQCHYSKSATFTLPEQDNAKKRKHEEDSNKHSSEHSNYVSPYKLSSTSMYPPRSKAVPSHSEFSTVGGHMGFVDFLEDPNVPTTFGGVPPPLPPHRPIIPGWQDFSWKPADYPPSTCPSSVDSRTRTLNYTSNDPEWHRKYYYGVGDSRCFNLQQIPTRNSQNDRFDQDMVSPKSTPHEIQIISAPYSLGQKEPIPKPSPVPTRLPASATTTHTAHSPRMLFSKPTTCSQPVPRIVTVRSPSPPPCPQVTAADIRRKPSLYKVPAWPHSREDSQATRSMALGERLSQTCDPESSNSRSLYPKIPQQAKAIASHTPNETSSSLQKPIPQPPKQQALAPKHSPNLIIDIAQTSQETFPFAAVAARHNKPIQKVFDTFSAIIQLPLLKQAADGRRHGPLGSERMRQYREAKRAMERANREREKGKGVRRGGGGTE